MQLFELVAAFRGTLLGSGPPVGRQDGLQKGTQLLYRLNRWCPCILQIRLYAGLRPLSTTVAACSSDFSAIPSKRASAPLAGSVQLHIRGLDDLGPFLHVALEDREKLLGRSRERLGALCGKEIDQVLILQKLVHIGIDAADHGRVRPGGRENSPPGIDVEAGKA